MPSSKGKPTDPKLREEAKKEVQQSGEGGAPGQWTANKAARMAKKYEEKGGDYENESGSKNKAKKGAPQPKDSGDIQDKPGQGKRKNQGKSGGSAAKKPASKKRKAEEDDDDEEEEEEEPEEAPEDDDVEEEEEEEEEEEKPKSKSKAKGKGKAAAGGDKKQKAAASQNKAKKAKK